MNLQTNVPFTRGRIAKLGLLSVALLATALVSTAAAESSGVFRRPPSGQLANATVTFGAWKTVPPLDRHLNLPPPPPTNQHDILPSQVRIQKGGAVSFLISGLHQPILYGNRTQPSDINASLTTPTTGMPAGVPLINDPTNRIYWGPDPSLVGSFDRVESLHFPNTGTYLVICGVQPHFVNDGMYAFISVVGEGEN